MKHLLAMIALRLALCPACAQITFPWHQADATQRRVCRVETSHTVCDAVVTFPSTSAHHAALFVDADAPDTPLSVFVGTNSTSLVIPGTLTPNKPRYLIIYLGSACVSERLTAPPPVTCDYAKAALGHAWDFEDGSQCGIASWGDRPHHLGPIAIKEGWLQIPVKDSDPYFIFGDMFGPSSSRRGLHIDSAVYRTLELRLRQSCKKAEWEFYVTDCDGHYKSIAFQVVGTDAQTFRFDLRASFQDFWDGRSFRALRIDTTNDKKDVLAEVDSVRLLPQDPAVTVGPVFTKELVAARASITSFKPTFPTKVPAGAKIISHIRMAGATPASSFLWSLATPEHGTVTFDDRANPATLPPFTRAGDCPWTLGLADDLGQPMLAVSGTVRVQAAEVNSYRLTPEKTFIDLQRPRTTLSIQGLDSYGNSTPFIIEHPLWTFTGNAQIPVGRVSGDPATIALTLPDEKPASYRIVLSDGNGHTGETAVTTVAYRKDPIRLNANGYLVATDGSLYFPVGGLYANWPHSVHSDGTIRRALDLFPCGPTPYKEGYPWNAETEATVSAYLKHCSERGITCLRLMLRNMDIVGRVDPVQLQATLHLFDLARPYGIRFNVALFEDYNKPPYVSQSIIDKIVLPHYTPDRLAALPPHRARFLLRKETLASPALRYSDPDVLACQRDYLRELIPALASREEVLCYEFENEMVYPPMAWCRATADFIRSIDPHTLILGNPGPHDWPEPLRWRDAGCDLFSYHPYNDGQPPADHGAVIFLRSKFAAQSGRPFYTGEGGLNQNRWQKDVTKIPVENAARGCRDQIWMSVCCGANGCLYWTLDHDAEAQEFAKVVPAFDALGLDLKTFKRQRPSVAVTLPSNLYDRRDAALAMRLLDLGVDFDTVSTNEASAYKVRLIPESQKHEALDLPATVARPSTGWQLATLVSDTGDRALLYLRNVAGGIKDFGAPPRPCHLRAVQPVEAAFFLRSPWRTITVFDLDTKQVESVIPDANGRVSLGVTPHDYLVGLHR